MIAGVRRPGRWFRKRFGRSSSGQIVFVGLMLVAIPTVFTVLSAETAGTPKWIKFLALAAWLALAWKAIKETSAREHRLDNFMRRATPPGLLDQRAVVVADERTPDDISEAFQVLAAASLIDDLLSNRWPGIPHRYELTLYLFDPDGEMLKPLAPSDRSADPVFWFSPGCGATGTAYARRVPTIATGDAVHDTTYGLTPEQSERFKRYQAVFAVPVEVGETVLGVLSGISKRDDAFATGPGGLNRINQLAAAVGTLLPAAIGLLNATVDEADADTTHDDRG